MPHTASPADGRDKTIVSENNHTTSFLSQDITNVLADVPTLNSEAETS